MTAEQKQELFSKLEAVCQDYGILTDRSYDLLDQLSESIVFCGLLEENPDEDLDEILTEQNVGDWARRLNV